MNFYNFAATFHQEIMNTSEEERRQQERREYQRQYQ